MYVLTNKNTFVFKYKVDVTDRHTDEKFGSKCLETYIFYQLIMWVDLITRGVSHKKKDFFKVKFFIVSGLIVF